MVSARQFGQLFRTRGNRSSDPTDQPATLPKRSRLPIIRRACSSVQFLLPRPYYHAYSSEADSNCNRQMNLLKIPNSVHVIPTPGQISDQRTASPHGTGDSSSDAIRQFKVKCKGNPVAPCQPTRSGKPHSCTPPKVLNRSPKEKDASCTANPRLTPNNPSKPAKSITQRAFGPAAGSRLS